VSKTTLGGASKERQEEEAIVFVLVGITLLLLFTSGDLLKQDLRSSIIYFSLSLDRLQGKCVI
jgi:hypothetical protein